MKWGSDGIREDCPGPHAAGMTHKEYLVVFIISVQNLVEITSVVLIIQKFEYFVPFS